MRNRQALILLFTAHGISGLAQGISMLAIPWYFAQHQTSGEFNFVYAIITFLTLFWGLAAGAIVDRFKRKYVFLVTNLIEGLILSGIAYIGWSTGSLSDAMILFIFALTFFGFNLHYPNLYALSQEITLPEHYTKITSYIEIVGQSTNVVSGALAALLLSGFDHEITFGLFGKAVEWSVHISPWPLYKIFTLDATTYFISLLLIWFIRYKPIMRVHIEQGSLYKRVKGGFSFLKKHREVFMFGLFSYSIFVVVLVNLHAITPLYIANHLKLGGNIFGTMQMFYAFGAFSAGMFVRRVFSYTSVPVAVIIMMFVTTGSLFAGIFITTAPLYFLIGYLMGFTNAGTRVLRTAFLFRTVPNQLIGRVNSIFDMTNVGLRTAFILLFSLPFFTIGDNIIYAYVATGLFTLFSGFMLIWDYNKLRKKKIA